MATTLTETTAVNTAPSPSHSAKLARSEFSFFHRLQVRRADIDEQGTVHAAHYLTYADTAFSAFMRSLAIPLQLSRARGDKWLLGKAQLEVFSAAREDAWLDCGVKVEAMEAAVLHLQIALFAQDKNLVQLRLAYQWLAATGADFSQALQQLLQGAPALRVEVLEWAKAKQDARQLRGEVFVKEQQIPQELEWDELDEQCLTAIGYNAFGLPVVTARLLPDGHIGRVATHQALRGFGFARQVMLALEAAARQRGHRETQLNAQLSAAAFYLRLGYQICGPQFLEADIVHVPMRKNLG